MTTARVSQVRATVVGQEPSTFRVSQARAVVVGQEPSSLRVSQVRAVIVVSGAVEGGGGERTYVIWVD